MTNQTTLELNTNEAPKKTKAEIVEAMKRLYVEISSINEDISALKEEAKQRGMDAALMAKVAKTMAESKTDDVLDKNEAFSDLVEEVRGS